MSKLIEKFFIPRPEPTDKVIDNFTVYVTQDGEELKWSAKFPLPAIGSRVRITLNSIGPAVVKGYFSSAGFLGVMTKATKPPKWLVAQQKRDTSNIAWIREGIGCEFGSEIILDTDAEKV